MFQSHQVIWSKANAKGRNHPVTDINLEGSGLMPLFKATYNTFTLEQLGA